MVRLVRLIIIFLVLCAAAAASVKPLIVFVARRQLQKTFPSAAVSIGSCRVDPSRFLALSDIRITRKPYYDFSVQLLGFAFTPGSLIRRTILKAGLEHSVVTIDLKAQPIREFTKLIAPGSGGMFAVQRLYAAGVRIDVNSGDLRLKAAGSFEFDPIQKLFELAELSVTSGELNAAQVKGLYIGVNRTQDSGEVRAENIKYGKLNISRLKGSARLIEDRLAFDPVFADMLGGTVRGSASLKFTPDLAYESRLNFSGLDISRFVRDFELTEKVRATGTLGGSLSVQGRQKTFEILAGDFNASPDGGTLTIKDTGFLENMARRSGKSLELVVESLKDYKYNIGIARAALEGPDILITVNMEGGAGKRDLSIILHDVNKRREQ